MHDELGLVVAQVQPPPHHHDGVVLEERPVLGHHPGNTKTSIEACRSSSTKRRHQVTLLRVLPLELGHHPADRAHHALGAEPGAAVGSPSRRSPAARRASSRCAGGGRARGPAAGGRSRRDRASPSRTPAAATCRTRGRGPAIRVPSQRPASSPTRLAGSSDGEQRGDAGLVLPAALERPVDDLVEHQAQALARVTQRVERAGLDQRLHGPLVEHDRVDPPAEVVEVLEGPCRLSLGDDPLDQALPDVAHRGQPEDDARARRRRRRHPPAQGRTRRPSG